MCLYDEENDNFEEGEYNDMKNMEQFIEEEEKEESLEACDVIAAQLQIKYECDRKKLKFKYKDQKFEAVPLSLNGDNKKCIFNVIKPLEQKGVKFIEISKIEII